MHTDRVLQCRECRAEFAWTAAEQQFYEQTGLRHAPRRCKACRLKRKASESPAVETSAPERRRRADPRPMYVATCSECGQEASIPFLPDPARPAYCTDCFRRRRALLAGSP